jgi:hypothetical protein
LLYYLVMKTTTNRRRKQVTPRNEKQVLEWSARGYGLEPSHAHIWRNEVQPNHLKVSWRIWTTVYA